MFHEINITEKLETSSYVSDALFGSNFLPNANSGTTPWSQEAKNKLGIPTIETLKALDALGVSHLRFPAGQDKELFSKYGFIKNDDLSPFVRNFLEQAEELGITVSMVVPVESLEAYGGPSAEEIYRDLKTFSGIISNEFPDTVIRYELGNEYWGGRLPNDESREVQYGTAAAKAAIALHSGAINADTPDLILQTASFLGGAFDGSIQDANNAIQLGFDSFTKDAHLITGIVRNFYWNDPNISNFENSEGPFQEDRGIFDSFDGVERYQWENWAGHSLSAHIGEYNIQTRVSTNIAAGNDIGVHGASMLLEHFTNMIAANIETANVWPILHNTKNALIHKHEDVEFSAAHGIEVVTNSTRSAIFDILRQTTVDHELVEYSWKSSAAVELTGFSKETSDGSKKNILFISSRDPSSIDVRIDLLDIAPSWNEVEILSVFYEDFGGSHRDAILSEIPSADAIQNEFLSLSLKPYEVVQISFSSPAPPLFTNFLTGTENDDFIVSSNTEGKEWPGDTNSLNSIVVEDFEILAGAGNDTIYTGNGHDSLDGGDGNDLIDSGWGKDWIRSGNGK